MDRESQISAPISKDTREKLERYTRATGTKKGHVIEQALLHYLAILDEVPPEFIIPRKIVLSREAFEQVVEQIDHPPAPTPALRKLMKGRLRR